MTENKENETRCKKIIFFTPPDQTIMEKIKGLDWLGGRIPSELKKKYIFTLKSLFLGQYTTKFYQITSFCWATFKRVNMQLTPWNVYVVRFWLDVRINNDYTCSLDILDNDNSRDKSRNCLYFTTFSLLNISIFVKPL